jgi:hypothetical protein
MPSRLDKLLSSYRQHLTVPWQAGLAAIQRVIFAVYDKTDELRLRANVEEFALVTQQAGKQWLLLDVTNAFPEWMAAQEYRDAYFESPEDLAGYQAGELTEFVSDLNAKLKAHIDTLKQAPTPSSHCWASARCSAWPASRLWLRASRNPCKGACWCSSPASTTQRTTPIACWMRAMAGTTWPCH